MSSLYPRFLSSNESRIKERSRAQNEIGWREALVMILIGIVLVAVPILNAVYFFIGLAWATYITGKFIAYKRRTARIWPHRRTWLDAVTDYYLFIGLLLGFIGASIWLLKYCGLI